MNRRAVTTIPFFLIAVAMGSLLPCISYYRNYEDLISSEAKRLSEIGQLASRVVAVSDFEKVREGYLAQNPALSQTETFQRLRGTLRAVQQSQQLESDLALFIRPDWKADHMVYVAMGADKSYIGNGLPLTAEAKKAWETRKTTAKMWSDETGLQYLTAYAPLLSEQGKILAVVQVDKAITKSLVAIRTRWFLETIVSLTAWLTLVVLGMWFWTREKKRSVKKLRDAIFASFPKEHLPFRALGDDSEETLASAFVTHTHSLRGENESLQKEKKKVVQDKNALEKLFKELSAQLEIIQTGVPAGVIAFQCKGRTVWCSKTFSEWFGKSPIGDDIGVVLQRSGRDFEEAFDSVFLDPARLPELISRFPSTLTLGGDGTTEKERSYHLSYQINVEPLDSERRWLFVAMTSRSRELELQTKWELATRELNLMKAYSLHKNEFVRLMMMLQSWTARPSTPALEEALILSRVFGLETLERSLSLALESPDQEALFVEINQTLAAFTEAKLTYEAPPVEEELGHRISFWPKYVEALADFFRKRVPQFVMTGDTTKAKWSTHDELIDSLKAVLRNAVEHGLETEAVRVQSDKPLAGKIMVNWDSFTASNGDPWCMVRISDDGAGIDPTILREDLKGFAIDASRDTNHSVLQHLFEQGVSLRDAKADWERKTGLHRLAGLLDRSGGVYELDSIRGKGTTLTVMFPMERAKLMAGNFPFLQAA